MRVQYFMSSVTIKPWLFSSERELFLITEGLKIDPKHIGINEYLGELYVATNRHNLAVERLEVLKNCNCSSCLKRSGAPICATLDCPNTVPCKPYKTEHGKLMKWGIYCRECSK